MTEQDHPCHPEEEDVVASLHHAQREVAVQVIGLKDQSCIGIKVGNIVGWAESNQLLKHQVTSQALFFKCQSDQIYLCDSYELGLT